MLALGFLHGLGADHLMAIAALSLATPLGPARYGRAFWLAVRFAVGHALLLSLGILASMSLFGIVLAHTLNARRMTGHVARCAAAATALGSVALGLYWIR